MFDSDISPIISLDGYNVFINPLFFGIVFFEFELVLALKLDCSRVGSAGSNPLVIDSRSSGNTPGKVLFSFS